MRSPTRPVAATAAAAIAMSTALVYTAASAAVPTDTSGLRAATTVDGVMAHEQKFQEIADANGGTRASGTAGYDASAAYVAGQLGAAGYKVTPQPFTFPYFSENEPAQFQRLSPDPETFTQGDDFFTMKYSGSGDVSGQLVPTNDVQIPPGPTANSSTSGCEAADFPAVSTTDPVVAFIQRGTCTFAVKAANAEAAGYDAVVIFNEGQEGRTGTLNGTLGGPGVTIPVIGTSFAVGEQLYQQTQAGTVTVRVFTSTTSETRTTSNILAETPGGRSDRTVVVGAHLDSVPEGPGINANGSGSSAILEIALQMARLGIEPTNKVRFASWGAEESGLLGAEYYVSQLSATTSTPRAWPRSRRRSVAGPTTVPSSRSTSQPVGSSLAPRAPRPRNRLPSTAAWQPSRESPSPTTPVTTKAVTASSRKVPRATTQTCTQRSTRPTQVPSKATSTPRRSTRCPTPQPTAS